VKIEIITPDSRVWSGDIQSVTVPGRKGSFQVLKDHAPIISTLDAGTVKLIDENGTVHHFEITGGLIEVKRNRIILLADAVRQS